MTAHSRDEEGGVTELQAEEHEIVVGIVSRFPRQRTWLLPVLWQVVEELGWLNPDRIEWISEALNVPYAEIYGVASFYSLFRWEPSAGPEVHVCTDVMCTLKSGDSLYDDLTRASVDQTFTVASVTCLGRCDAAPACLVNYEPVENATIAEVLERLRTLAVEKGGEHS